MNNNQQNFDPMTGQPIVNNNQQLNTNIQPSVENKKVRKKKYWLIPILVFVLMILAPIINITLRLVGVDSSIIGSISTIIYVLCGLAFIPSIIVAIVLSSKNK